MATFTNELLDQVCQLTETKSDYAAAKVLRISKQAVSRYRAGAKQMSDEPAIKAAELLGIDPVQVLARLHIERSKSEKARQVWSRISDMAKSAACILLTAGAVNLAQSPAASAFAAYDGPQLNVYYVKFLIRTWLQRLLPGRRHCPAFGAAFV